MVSDFSLLRIEIYTFFRVGVWNGRGSVARK